MKTEIVITKTSKEEGNEFTNGENGFIDGYVNGINNEPCAVVIISKKIVLVPFDCFRLK